MGRRGARRAAERVAALAAGPFPRAGGMLRRTPATPDPRAVFRTDQDVDDAPYRERWAHGTVRALHPRRALHRLVLVEVYVKDGLITWETQETNHPSTGPDRPGYEPRGRPRGASFSW